MKKIIVSAILSLFLFACTNSFFVSEEKEKNKEETKDAAKTGSMKISFSTNPYNKNISRTVVADFSTQITNWEVKISKGTVDFKSNVASGSATFSDLEPGLWSVLLTGKNSSDNIVADGTSDVTISEGSTSTCSINTKFRQSGTGSFSLTFEYPASSGINYVEGAFENNPADILVASIDSSNPTFHKAIFSKSGVPSGGYQFGIILRKGGATGEVAGAFLEAVNIWDNTLSDKFLGVDGAGNITFSSVKTFNENDLSDRNANLSAITISDCILDSVFDFSDITYEASITSDNFTFTPKRSIAGQSIKYSWNGGADTPIASDATSAPLTIGNMGSHILLVTVTSPDRTKKPYTFNCVRKYKVTYDANIATSGTPPTDSNYYANGEAITILGNTGNLSKTDKIFLKWNTQADGKGDSYSIGSSVSMATSDITLYAEWGITLTESQRRVTVMSDIKTATIQGKTITLSPFEIGKYEVNYELWYTVRKWAEDNKGYVFVTSTKHGREGSTASSDNSVPTDKKTEPVVYLGWINAALWCNAYTEYYNANNAVGDVDYGLVYYSDEALTNLLKTPANATTPVYMLPVADGYRLPTEAEWEFAARGGDPTDTTNWVYTYSGSDDINTVGWTSETSNRTRNIGLLTANSLGLYDISGNAAEWCWDYYSETITWSDPDTNPVNNIGAGSRVVRGGNYLYAASSAANNSRGARTITTGGGADVGFRVARNLGSVMGRKSGSGGIIFYDAGEVNATTYGWRYLEIAPAVGLQGGASPNLYAWSTIINQNAGTDIILGSGKFNTMKIMVQNSFAESAAKKATEYTSTIGSINYNDWFLPAKDEFSAIPNNESFMQIVSFVWDYWSSSEIDNTRPWRLWRNGGNYAVMGNTDTNPKESLKQVRPIRAFRSLTDNKPTYIVVYDKNGADVTGIVPVDNKYYQTGEPITVLGNSGTLQKSGFNFVGWYTLSAGGDPTHYNPGDKKTVGTQNIVLYAEWSNAIQIENATQLAAIGTDATTLGNSYILTQDITLTSEWTPIGNNVTPFTGTLDGNGKKITNLTISSADLYLGLFGETSNTAMIKNLGIDGVDITNTASGSVGGHRYTGTLVGNNLGMIQNCYFINGNIKVENSITGGNTFTGGVTGFNKGTVEKSFSSVNVNSFGSLGGISGYNDNDSGSGTIGKMVNCYAMGNIEGISATNAGGLVGRIDNGVIQYSYSMGIVTGGTNIGGLIGFQSVSGTITVTSSYYDANTSGQSGGIYEKTTAEMKTQGTFSGWDFTNIWGIDATKNWGYPFLLNKYPANVYTVLYDANGGTGGTPPFDNTFYQSGQTVTVKNNSGALTRTNYTFGGWNTQADGNGTNYTAGSGTFNITSDTKLFARWTGNPYTITFDMQSGTGGTATATATYGSAMPTATAPTRTGYTFAGYWDVAVTGGNQYYSNAMVSVKNWDKTANTDLYARWTAGTYTVTFNKQSGTGGTDSATAIYGSAMPSATAPTRTGYTFTGYWDATTGGNQYYSNAMASLQNWDKPNAATLYARWTGNSYTITFDMQSGSGGTTLTTATYGSPMPTGLTAPTRADYIFTGYWDAPTGGTQYYTDAMTSVRNWDKTSATTLYAQWGGTMYVSTTGNDSNNGLTTSTPKLTIQAAIDAGGIEIRVAVGTYSVTNPITISGKPIQLLGGYAVGFGSRNSYQTLVDRNTYLTKIIYVGSDNGGDGTNNYSYNDSSFAVYFDSNVSNNSLIEGFIVEGKTSGYNTSAIKINYSCSPVIRYNTIIAGKGSKSTTGIISYGTKPLIENNVIYGGAEVNAGWGHTAIRCAYNITINNNTIYGNTTMDQSEGTGIALGDDSDKIISNNYIYARIGISSFYAISKIYNNVIVSSLYGISLRSSGNATSTPSSSIIINNTIFNSGTRSGSGIKMESIYAAEKFDYPVIINNIISNFEYGIQEDTTNSNTVMPYEMKNNNIVSCTYLYRLQNGTTITDTTGLNTVPVYNTGHNGGNISTAVTINADGTLSSPSTDITQGGLVEPAGYLTDFPKNSSDQYTDKDGTINRSADGTWSIGAFEY